MTNMNFAPAINQPITGPTQRVQNVKRKKTALLTEKCFAVWFQVKIPVWFVFRKKASTRRTIQLK